MATFSFDSISQRFNKEFTGKPQLDKILNKAQDITMDSAMWVGKNSDILLIGAAALMLGDIAESLDALEDLTTLDIALDHDLI
jgi:hypothetical protein